LFYFLSSDATMPMDAEHVVKKLIGKGGLELDVRSTQGVGKE
jgi:hypothetical protein